MKFFKKSYIGVIFCLLATVDANIIVKLSSSSTIGSFFHRYPQIMRHVGQVYSFGDFIGFSGNFNLNVIRALQHNPFVKSIVPDTQVMTTEEMELRDKFTYEYFGIPKELVDVYVVDTGVRKDHPQLEGRVTFQKDFTGEGIGDTNGHGTHVAGLVGSHRYGVFKQARFIDLKVLQGTGVGNLSTVIAGIDYAVNHRMGTRHKAVANLSVGATYNVVLNDAVNAAVESGLLVVVAAGNANSAACNYSPASASRVVTVGAVDDRYDAVASFSNWGRCVDIFASGVYVVSLSPHQESPTMALSGTSMSAPIVAGIMAQFMAQGDGPEEAIERLLSRGTHGAIPRSSLFLRPRTINLLAYNREPDEEVGGGAGEDEEGEDDGDDEDYE
ncbi:uncharacterized protein SAPINGB_P004174 [Magnusiomyces paraingens]|uniref:Peptidase S8/S53 domain-containing protein n=1 Tax=Magnusiomyces paraingens TaxID=2606893 RepID=A0A5E8BV94_9ASCO|nr:uncharacterized protein SAPINGB_P004174 [Saprochaete ingens]VVT54634.1 unnamed protein product [Saprochaete ingens]